MYLGASLAPRMEQAAFQIQDSRDLDFSGLSVAMGFFGEVDDLDARDLREEVEKRIQVAHDLRFDVSSYYIPVGLVPETGRVPRFSETHAEKRACVLRITPGAQTPSMPALPPGLILGRAQAVARDVAFMKAHQLCFRDLNKAPLIFRR